MAAQMTEVRSAGAMGQGLFAVTDIAKGTRIIAESPFILLEQSPAPFAMFCGIVQDLGDDISKLDELTYNEKLLDEDQPHNLLDQLRGEGAEVEEDDLEDEDVYEMLERYAKLYTNSAEIKSNGKYIGAGVFLAFSRMNHSCVPNAFSNWNSQIGQQTVQAARDIKAGEQIFFSYLGREGTFKSQKERASMIEKFWGFDCGCSDCVDSETSDVLRGRMGLLDQEISRLSELCQAAYGTEQNVDPLAKEALAKVQTLMTLMDEAGLGGWKMVESLQDATMFSFILGDFPQVVNYAKMNLDTQKLVLGEDGVDKAWVKELATSLPAEFESQMLRLVGGDGDGKDDVKHNKGNREDQDATSSGSVTHE